MDSLIHVAGWSQHQQDQPARPSSARPFGHLRSLSSVAVSTCSSSPPSPAPSKIRPFSKSPLPPQPAPIPLRPSHSVPLLNDEMSTLPDPRSRLAFDTVNGHGANTPNRNPGLDDELATLSTKLINAINHQTLLDDTLSATRHELQSAQTRIRELESDNQSQRDMLRGDVWVRRSSLDTERKALLSEKKTWQAKLADETSKRLETEREKKKIEQELENLTTALFEEANKMVIAAKEEAQAVTEALQRKNEQLRSQLADTENLLQFQQEQLAQLKGVMESMASERDDATNGTAPPSPGVSRLESADDSNSLADALRGTSPSPDAFAPCNPTSLQHLIQPVLRTDLAAYDDFLTLARFSNPRRGNRISSGSMGGVTPFILGGSTPSTYMSNGSTTSLTTSTPTPSSAPQSPNTPASSTGVNSPTNSGFPAPNLRDTRYYKRVLIDDIEPTLRLDVAPGLSWLARRSVLAAVTDGSLIVEPVPDSATYKAIVKPLQQPCSLCGESRESSEHLRNHRLRTSEAASAQRYPLCSYCLNRVRSTCDFLSFLRLVRDGHWRAEDEDQEKAAWEESVRLREQMFWARIGGGVVPACHVAVSAPAHSDKDSRPSQDQMSVPEDFEPIDVTSGDIADITDSKRDDDLKAPSPVRTPPNEPERPLARLAIPVRP